MDPQTRGMLIGGIGSLAAIGVGYLATKFTGPNPTTKTDEPTPSEEPATPTPRQHVHEESKSKHGSMADLLSKPAVMLLGDVGGTNIRLVLRKVYLHDIDRPSEDIKDAVTHSQTVRSFEEAVANFL